MLGLDEIGGEELEGHGGGVLVVVHPVEAAGEETFISTTQDTTVMLKSIQYYILNTYIAAVSASA